MRHCIILLLSCFLLFACNSKQDNRQEQVEQKAELPQVHSISEKQYQELVFDYNENPSQWKFNGKRPCVVDFYADWCRPCKMIAPFFDTLAVEYKGKIDFYKVNVEDARELSAFFQINSIPFVTFCSDTGCTYINGAQPIEVYRQIIDEFVDE